MLVIHLNLNAWKKMLIHCFESIIIIISVQLYVHANYHGIALQR